MVINPLQHALVPVAQGRIKSKGRVLVTGETVKAFWGWPKRTQNLFLKNRKIVMLPAADALKANKLAVELRSTDERKIERANLAGLQAELQGIKELLDALEAQADSLLAREKELQGEIAALGEHIEKRATDPGERPADHETEILSAQEPENEVEAAVGIVPKEPELEEEPESNPVPEQEMPKLSGFEAAVAEIVAEVSKTTYRDLQVLAKQLNIKSVGIKRKKLVQSVAEALAEERLKEGGEGEGA